MRQVVHHIADSHMHAYIRTKWILTEEQPRIKTYEEVRWAELPDTRLTPVETSLALAEHLHFRWAVLLRTLPSADFNRTMDHPESGPTPLNKLMAIYSWHGRHHLGHITSVKE